MKVLNPQNSVPRLEWHLPHFIFIAFRILFIRKKMFGKISKFFMFQDPIFTS